MATPEQRPAERTELKPELVPDPTTETIENTVDLESTQAAARIAIKFTREIQARPL